ncbi:MAG: hypothetical protein P8L85_23200 [Rubripirellula sp.]|nr:hypothetical protein [Rubripirellula sp.]
MTSNQYFHAVKANQNRLHAFILPLLADPMAAQDVSAETNHGLIGKANGFQADASFEFWAYCEYVAIHAGQKVAPGQLNLDHYLVRLNFISGAMVLVDGLATVDIVDELWVVLQRGFVMAIAPESTIGFVVDTNFAHVVDLGTACGAAVAEAGATDVVAFEGEVAVCKERWAANRSTLVLEGQAVRASEESPKIEAMDDDVIPFGNAWTVSSGVLQATGSICLFSPAPSFHHGFHHGKYADSEHLVVFPERSGVMLDDVIRVDLKNPGGNLRSRCREKRTLRFRQLATIYLSQIDSFSFEKFSNNKREVRGQITFSHIIIGVIAETRRLKESVAVFGASDVVHPTPSADEPRPEGDERRGFDRVILAGDQRTLVLDLKVAPQELG